MSSDVPQLYLVLTPPFNERDAIELVERMCDSTEIAAIRLALAALPTDDRLRFCDQIRGVTETRNIALVATDDPTLAERAALDGVHLTEGLSQISKLRKAQGDGAIIGAFCGTSRHDGMVAGENGADYVTFGPVGKGDAPMMDDELFAWWSEFVEIPVVAEGELDEARIAQLSDKVDFFSFGAELWQDDDPVAKLHRFATARKG